MKPILIYIWLLSGKTANVHSNDLRSSPMKLLCSPREVSDRKELVAAINLGVPKMSDIVLSRARLPFLESLCVEKGIISEPVIFQGKDEMEAKKSSIVGECASDEERAMHWILGKFLSHTLAATHSMIDNGGVAENIGFLHRYLDLATVMVKTWVTFSWST